MFKPQNPAKYRGCLRTIAYRSGWELSCMSRLDRDPAVLWWQSEEVVVPYSNPVSGAFARYFPDFCYAVKGSDGKEVVTMVEVKPHAQTRPPRRGARRNRKKLVTESITYAKNVAKWEAANRFCEKRGWTFKILTEKEIGAWK